MLINGRSWGSGFKKRRGPLTTTRTCKTMERTANGGTKPVLLAGQGKGGSGAYATGKPSSFSSQSAI